MNECYRAYSSWIDENKNPYLSNLFIPKTHEAVELLSAFLIGNNQTISAEPEGNGDEVKACFAEKLLDFQWRKTLSARHEVLIWVKQAATFGNGIMKLGWNYEKNSPFMHCVNLPDIYMDYYQKDIDGGCPVIHRIVEVRKKVIENEIYNDNKNLLSVAKTGSEEDNGTNFASYDGSGNSAESSDKVELLEMWTNESVVTIGETGMGWKILRNDENPYGFIPFEKVRFKTSPLPNRAYDTGAIEPTLKLQMAFNDMANEVFDNVSLINNKQWIKKRGSNINPMDMVRRPGGVITVDNIETDLKSEEVGDIKASAFEMLKILDNEFQQASMVVNLLKGIPSGDTATEASIGQQNVQTLLDMIDGNVKEALSKLGEKLLKLNIDNSEENYDIKVFEDDERVVYANFSADEIDGKFDVKIIPDRQNIYSRVVQQKQLTDIIALLSRDEITKQKYPNLMEKVYKKWFENAGFSDLSYFFSDIKPEDPMLMAQVNGEMGGGAGGANMNDFAGGKAPRTEEGLNPNEVNGDNSSPVMSNFKI
jgi:hypothetical protein